MTTTIISFYIAFLGIIGMIGMKRSEIRSGKKSWFSRLTDITNDGVYSTYLWIKKMISYINKRSAIALIQWIAYHILSWVRKAYIWIHKKAHAYPHSKKVIDMVRGKGEINKNGGASVYLKRISEEDEEVLKIK